MDRDLTTKKEEVAKEMSELSAKKTSLDKKVTALGVEREKLDEETASFKEELAYLDKRKLLLKDKVEEVDKKLQELEESAQDEREKPFYMFSNIGMTIRDFRDQPPLFDQKQLYAQAADRSQMGVVCGLLCNR